MIQKIYSSVFVIIGLTIVYGAHECERPCVAGMPPKTCYYKFHEQEYSTMGRACFDCINNPDDCERPDCVPGDGVPVPFIAINKKLPGPAIQVCEGDEIVVDLENSLYSDTETLHWHGQHQRTAQFMDGVPFITQCPITGTFRYQFTAATPGTSFWHSHSGAHRLAGVLGILVVRQTNDVSVSTYDHDDPSHVFLLEDWIHVSASSKLINRRQYKGDDNPSSILVNGRGKNTMAQKEGVEVVNIHRHVVEVEFGLRYRLRFINGAGMNCPITISVDNHNFTIIAVDGQSIQPVQSISSFTMYLGERFDIVIDANQVIDNYWIRFVGLQDCESNECIQGVVLRYSGAPKSDPTRKLEYSQTPPSGIYVNPHNLGPGNNVLTIADLNGNNENMIHNPCLFPDVDKRFYLEFDSNNVNNSNMYDPVNYPYNSVSKEFQRNTPQINDLTFKFPSIPPLMHGTQSIEDEYCRYGETSHCEGEFCSCTYLLEVGLGDTVEMVLLDRSSRGHGSHPFHLHGASFYVVALGRLGSKTTLKEVQALDASGGIKRKLKNPILKDTVIVPPGGYTVIRFTADNPGYWLMHCHIMFHSAIGMSALLKIGTDKDMPKVPDGFPTCGNYLPEIRKQKSYDFASFFFHKYLYK